MRCRSVLTRLDARRTGELRREDDREVDAHLHTCNSCHQSVDDVASLASALRALPHPTRRSSAGERSTSWTDRFDSVEEEGRQIWVAFSGRGVRAVDLRSTTADEFRKAYNARFGRDVQPGTLPAKIRSAIVGLLRGEKVALPEVDLTDRTEFEQSVLRTICAIPRGEVRSYEWVARQAGRERAVRAVGNVMASNPIPLILPCHRVVPTAGGLGSYGYGPELKRQFLLAENAPVEELENLARKGVRYVGSRTTRIFCFPTCRDARRIRDDNRVAFHDAAEAREGGYRPCKRCTPVAA